MIKDHPLERIRDIYVENLDLKHQTIQDYVKFINRYIHYLKRYNIKYAKRSDIIKYRDSMWAEDLKATTVQKQMVVIKNFYRWIRINWSWYGFSELYSRDVSEGIKGAKIEKRHRKSALTLPEAKEVIDYAQNLTKNLRGLRNYCMLLLMLTTGLRTIEIARAKRSDLDRMGDIDILYVHGKGKDGADNFVKLSEPVKNVIKEYLFYRSDHNKYLFITNHHKDHQRPMTTDSIRTALKQLLVSAGFNSSRYTVHSLRHTCATLSIETGGSLEATQQLLRHANIETTLIYAHHLNRMKDDTEERISNILFQKEGEEIH